MKKIFCFLVSVIMIVAMMPQAIGASSDSNIKWQEQTVNLNESFSIIVTGENIAPGKSLGIWVDFDESVLQFKKAEWLSAGDALLQEKEGEQHHHDETAIDVGQVARADGGGGSIKQAAQ